MSARDEPKRVHEKMPKREKDIYIQRQLHTRAKIYRYMKRKGVEELGHGKEDDKRDKEKSLCARTSISTRDLNKEGSTDISGRGNSSSSGSMYQRQGQY